MSNYCLALDIGIASIGLALLDNEKNILVDFGTRSFQQAKQAKESRGARGSRRTLRHKKWRKQQMKQALVDFGLITEEMKNDPEYFSFTINNEKYSRPSEDTVYHLQLKALNEKVSIRELVLAMYNICGTRGHFLLEQVDFSNGTITFDLFKEQFYELVSQFIELDFDLTDFENKVLIKIFSRDYENKKSIDALLKQINFNTEHEANVIKNMCILLAGYSAKLASIDESILLADMNASKTFSVKDLLAKDELNDFLEKAVELHDLIIVHTILNEYNYICEFNVKKLNEIHSVYKMEKGNPDGYKQKKNEIQGVMNSKKLGNKLRVIRNTQNKYPNGLYVKELVDILRKQQEFYPELISDEFIEVCSSIVSARIPYYIGPLSSQGKNAWIERDENIKFKYSYDYTIKNFGVVNELETIRKWKKAMISRCTYFPEEYALPKSSFLGETFSILNELNILYAEDKNGNQYYLTMEDKVKLFNELFLLKGSVSFKDVCDKLDLAYFGPKSKGVSKKFNTGYSLYLRLAGILPELKLESITDLYLKKDKIERIEEILLNVNLFDEEVSKYSYFRNELKFTEDIAKALSKLKSKGFYSFSKKLINEVTINQKEQTLLDCLFDDNTSEYTNEQMTLLHSAVTVDGKSLNLESNKYLKRLKENGGKLNIDLICQNGKSIIPISRPVIRALNECFKVYLDVCKMYGVPKRIVIESAKDLLDSTQKKSATKKHTDMMKECYDDLQKQIKEYNKKHDKKVKCNLEEWDQLTYYLSTKRKEIELYIRQNGCDIITGKQIELMNLDDYEKDHILPRGFGNDSLDNMILIHKNHNAKKSNRVPLEYIEEDNVLDRRGKRVTSSDFEKRCKELYDLKLISENKYKQLMLKSSKDVEGFINRNLVDTRYIISEFMAILNAYNTYHNYDCHIVALKAKYTELYRSACGIRKNRNIGDQHHAYDALMVGIADRVLSTYYPNYDSRGNFDAYQEFVRKLGLINKTAKKDNDVIRFIRFMYKYTFGHFPSDPKSIVSYAKKLRPLYSLKAERGYTGQFFDATLHSPEDKKGVLDFLGVNNSNREFKSVKCVAVDIFKYTELKKGKKIKKFVGIQIPKCIVNSDGLINKEKYLILIKDYYKIPQLIDENGELNQSYFKLRLYKNDLIYDTDNNILRKFDSGTIASKKVQYNYINCFSIEDIEKSVNYFKEKYALEFDFKLYNVNPDGKKQFSDYPIEELIDYGYHNLLDIKDDNYFKGVIEDLKSIDKYQMFLERLAFLKLIIHRKYEMPFSVNRFRTSLNTVSEDAQYIKVKTSTLGIRFKNNEKGTLVISGPHMNSGAYSCIKKEKFTWNLSKDMLE